MLNQKLLNKTKRDNFSLNSLKKHLKYQVFNLIQSYDRTQIMRNNSNKMLNSFINEYFVLIKTLEKVSIIMDDRNEMITLDEKKVQCSLENSALFYKFKIKICRKYDLKVAYINILYETVRRLPNLQILILDFGLNYISYKGFELIVKTIDSLRKIIKLKIAFRVRNLNNHAFHSLFNSISVLKDLITLSLAFPFSNLNDLTICMISRVLCGLVNLKKLIINFDGNKLTYCKSLEELGSSLTYLKLLNYLSISFSNNSVTNREVKALSNSLRTLKELKTLKVFLQNNNISDEGVDLLSESVNSLKHIVVFDLNLSNNKQVKFNIKRVET